VADGWGDFIPRHIANIYNSGSGVLSVTDALVMSRAYFNSLGEMKPNELPHVYFRGQVNIEWPIQPRFARKCPSPLTADPTQGATPEELAAIADFQNRWKSGLIEADQIDIDNTPSDDSKDWWSLMTHYDDTVGTRLIDLTTDPLVALYFACVDWDGAIDESVDGVVYLLDGGSGNVRFHFPNPKGEDWYDTETATLHDYFPSKHPNTPRLIMGAPHNERLKAQHGAFLWWPRFDADLPLGVHYLRVCGRAKPSIVRELLSYNIDPRLIVRGNRGVTARKHVLHQLRLADPMT
jgi:hypothetical protein